MSYVLLTNDDSIDAPGILAVARALSAQGHRVGIIAPGENQSMSGHKITVYQDIRVEDRMVADEFPGVAVYGSPADCIVLASIGLVEWPPRLVVSGINRGPNMGQDTFYSGTVSAALEATIRGIPAIAVSLDNQQANDIALYTEAARITAQIVAKAIQHDLPPFTALNLNIPSLERVKGIRLTRQGVRIYRNELERSADGGTVRVMGEPPTGVLDEIGTDLWAVHNGYASLTPLQLDLTEHSFMAELAAWDVNQTEDE